MPSDFQFLYPLNLPSTFPCLSAHPSPIQVTCTLSLCSCTLSLRSCAPCPRGCALALCGTTLFPCSCALCLSGCAPSTLGCTLLPLGCSPSPCGCALSLHGYALSLKSCALSLHDRASAATALTTAPHKAATPTAHGGMITMIRKATATASAAACTQQSWVLCRVAAACAARASGCRALCGAPTPGHSILHHSVCFNRSAGGHRSITLLLVLLQQQLLVSKMMVLIRRLLEQLWVCWCLNAPGEGKGACMGTRTWACVGRVVRACVSGG